MSKKNFSGGLESLLGDYKENRETRGRAKKKSDPKRPSPERGLDQGYTRATFIVSKENLEKLKTLAYWERSSIKEQYNQALESYLRNHEETNGKIKPKPKRNA